MARNFEFDKDSYSFRKPVAHITSILLGLLKLLLLSLAITVIAYTLLALVLNSDVDRMLIRENRMYSKYLSELKEDSQIVQETVASIQIRDDEIYDMIFHSESPSMDPFGSDNFSFQGDSIPEGKLISYTARKADALLIDASYIEKDFLNAFKLLSIPEYDLPPMNMPLENVSFPQVGASVGDKVSPFLKTYARHEGLDLIASLETPVYAAASGVVIDVVRSRKTSGNLIEIRHNDTYTTRYCHLGEISVKKGQSVKLGQKIGSVGMTGNSFAPHLHYEVRKDGEVVDPINFIFASVDPNDYANMLYMAVNIDKSMD